MQYGKFTKHIGVELEIHILRQQLQYVEEVPAVEAALHPIYIHLLTFKSQSNTSLG
jgi:hypothetical protein